MEDLELLRDVERTLSIQFAEKRQLLSFDEFFTLFCEEPRQHSRTAAQYLRDTMLHFGTYEVERPEGAVTRYRLFDCPWSDGKDRVVGQEAAQNALFRLINGFARERRVTRLMLLHGPNGSAKSSLIECLCQAIEQYSATAEGAIYRFNWIFPSMSVAKKRLGFGASTRHGALESYAQLDDTEVDARLPADLRDHPLLLLPRDQRRTLIDRLREASRLPEDEPLGEYLVDGDLAPRSRAIVNALMAAYHGDLQRVLQHIQVERFYFSRRYRTGIVTIEPQLHVDAGVRQVTMDQGLGALPSALRNLSMYEPFGDLVDANRGILNYNDLLKKPVDAFKYLLATCERGTVALSNAILHLDVVFLASSNEVHLRAFKEYPDWPSFKGRMDLVKMPYLRDYTVEQAIYDEQIARSDLGERVVPHTTWVLALWAVLTRLQRPHAEGYPTQIRDAIARLTPIEKAELYAGGRTPRDLNAEQTRELRAMLPELLAEGQEQGHYEGSLGASPREMKQTILNALQDRRHWGVSPLGVLAELRELIKQKSVYEYLQLKPDGGYHDYASFIDQVEERWLERVDGELRGAMGLVSEQQYEDLFARYILHVSYALKGEKLYNAATGRYEAPDTQLMGQLEKVWEITGDLDRFRKDLVSRVGAWRVEHQADEIAYRRLFPKLIGTLEDDYYKSQRAKVQRQCEQLVTVLVADDIGEDPTHHGLQAADVERTRQVLEQLTATYGYKVPALREILGAVLKARY
ncbi:MAG: serine protein kinase [Deltaproteobacteria bacterium HGW-Deltaproteobacteria-14]|jgi:predicted Ser/Thr protein kinase|nr:MAG: serine protein kinase [Deltaproteobacteria bacterium HGW-Deltaproteobacteria-14]